MENEVNDVRIEDSDGEEEPAGPADEDGQDEGEGDERMPEKVLLCGWIYKCNGNWFYERFNFSFFEEKFPHFLEEMGKLEVESRNYVAENMTKIQLEKETLKANLEKEAEKAA